MAYRTLDVFAVSENLGPKIEMISKMFIQMFQFLSIMGIFIFAYGVAQQSLQYSNEQRGSFILKVCLKEPPPTLTQLSNSDFSSETENFLFE